MSRRHGSSSVRARPAPLPDMIGEYPLGTHTGLPLIMCPECGGKRVVELVVQTDEHGNRGKVFFKCPRNIRGLEMIQGSCSFFEWPREYLAILVDKGKIVMVLGQQAGGADEEADSRLAVRAQKTAMEGKLDTMVDAVKALTWVLGAGVVVGAMYVLK